MSWFTSCHQPGTGYTCRKYWDETWQICFANQLLIQCLISTKQCFRCSLSYTSIFFSPHFNYQFHANTAALISVMKASMRWEFAKCSCLWYQSFLEKTTLVCLQSQDKAHRRFKWGRDLLRVFRFSFILKKWCKWQNKCAKVFLSIPHPMFFFPQSSEDMICKCCAMFQKLLAACCSVFISFAWAYYWFCT